MIQVEIVIKGKLDKDWSDWFDSFEITHGSEHTILKGPVRDQAELRGILSRLADVGLELVSVNTLSDSCVLGRPERGGDNYKTEISS